ncbi:GNAT family N-acetyltransferase [Solimicrobium silvestre]|uniref:Acetyltransferase (GNAT) family n=1 Tax=Solimicrobium silvestre TaxID=2099400 RepID=A0A2S9GSI8_9BURK|nr:GNAT family N-acetyltransferase [Solimicrobium silvestre]PRC90684.1 Acetyltransferase (GNAT) family [Solimicrobium silvestre]
MGEESYGEIKRVFVMDSHRGKGISKRIMSHLEKHLVMLGVPVARLETGVKQPEALKSLGYVACAPFGGYALDPFSMFMDKRLLP